MARPYGLLRCGFPFAKTLGMRRLTNYPIDVALGDEERLYVLCRADNAALVRRYSYGDEDLGQFGSVGKEDGQFMWPVSIIADSEENVFVSDEYLNRISSFKSDGEFLNSWGEPGSEPGQLDHPSGIAFDAEENVYVSDTMNHRVQKFTKDGEFITAFGEFGSDKGKTEYAVGHQRGRRRGGVCGGLAERPRAEVLGGRGVHHEVRRGRAAGTGSSTGRRMWLWMTTGIYMWRTGETTACRCSTQRQGMCRSSLGTRRFRRSRGTIC